MSEQAPFIPAPAAVPAGVSASEARSDHALVAAVKAGDASAFEAVMRRHNRLMFRTARAIVTDDADAQDVVQEAYLRAFTAMQTYRGDAALSTSLARIAINVALGLQRADVDAAEATQLYAFAGERCDEVVAAVLAQLHARGLIRPH